MKKRHALTRREFMGTAAAGLAAGLQSGNAARATALGEGGQSSAPSGIAHLREILRNPPDSARPMTRWWWFGGAVTQAEITRELELMRAAGIGGVELQPVYPLDADDPGRGIRNTPFFSQEWFDLIRHTGKETHRLGLQFDLTLGSGWPYGGPFVPGELGSRRLRVVSRDVAGGSGFTWDLTSHLVAEEIVAVVAAPVLPSQQPDLTRARLLTDQVKVLASTHIGERIGLDRWPVPDGEWRIMLFMDSPNGMMVKRPTVGMEGLVIDHFSREALDLFLRAVGDRTLKELKPLGFNPVTSVFCDSLEVFGADWTPRFMQEFRKRRGYDLAPYLPALSEDAGPLTPHIRYDYHQTLSDLTIENFFRPLVEWSERNGVRTRIQAHGAYGDIIEGYAASHIPEGEHYLQGDRYFVSVGQRRLASSAAHLYLKPIISAETYTWLRVPRFIATLEMMKAATDSMFLDGINQIVNHGYPYSPPEAGQPGRLWYSSVLINHTNLWWRHYPHLARYVHRAAALLREGVSVNPVAVYLPLADIFAKFGSGPLHVDEAIDMQLGRGFFEEVRRAGYDFDIVNDRVLSQTSRIDQGKIKIGTGEYSVVIVPGVRFMPPESLERLAQFAASGGRIVFMERLPESAPGLENQDARTARLKATLDAMGVRQWRLSNDPAERKFPPTVLVPDGKEALHALESILDPDCRIIQAGAGTDAELKLARENVGFVHRRGDSCDLYFLSNLSNQMMKLRARLATGHRRPERWNLEGETRTEPVPYSYVLVGGAMMTEIQLCLASFESCFVVFGESSEAPLVTRTNAWSDLEIVAHGGRTQVRGRAENDSPIWVESVSGRRRSISMKGVPQPISLEGSWSLKLGDGATVPLVSLISWNDLANGKTFSGWGTYEIDFNFAGQDKDLEWTLDLGRVHETAEVDLNNISLGATWKGVRRLKCGDALKLGKNHLVVRVGNLWIHQMQSRPKPDLRALEETYGVGWDNFGDVEVKDLPPSGLLGPVRLIASKHWTLRI